MAKLKAATRNILPKSEARATQQVNNGKLSPAQAAKIRAKANAILGGR